MTVNRIQREARRPMSGRRRSMRAALVAAAVVLAGCVSVPEAVRGTSPTPQDDLVQVMHAPQLYVGQESRFGGRVVAVRNDAEKTRLEIVSMPLDRWARPQLGRPSEGRLVAYVKGFIEPVEVKDKLVTVVGPISGTEQGAIDAKPYRFVVIDVRGYKRWNEVQQVRMPYGVYDPWDWRYRRGWGFGYYDGFGPALIETVVTE